MGLLMNQISMNISGCPFIENATDEVVRELLFSPGEHRIRLLQWLFGKIDANIYNHIEKQPKYATNNDWRWNNMLTVAVAFGLTGRQDLDVIAGTASVEKQASFYDKLLNIAIVMDRVESADKLTSLATLREQFQNNTAFLTQAIASNAKQNAFPSSVTLFPMDINRIVQENWKEKGWKQGSDLKPPVPDRKHLTKQIEELTENYHKQRQALIDLKKTAAGFEPDKTDETTRACIRSRYSLVLSSLSQILTDFSYCFANDMEVWCSKATKNFENNDDDEVEGLSSRDELGPQVRQAFRLVKSLSMLIGDLKSLACLPSELRNCCELAAIEKKCADLEIMKRNFEYSKNISRASAI